VSRCIVNTFEFTENAAFMSFTWFEERHEGQTLVDDVVTKHVPPHIGLFYCLGGIVFMALVAQFTSGLVLTFCPSCHMTGGLKKPRELTWVSGALLSFLALSFGVSGYSLPWDEIGFWALQVVSAVPETTDDFLPGVGSSIVCPIRGGFSIGQETLNRAFTAHTLTLPAGAAIVSLLHFLLIRKQSVSGPLWRCWRCHVERHTTAMKHKDTFESREGSNLHECSRWPKCSPVIDQHHCLSVKWLD